MKRVVIVDYGVGNLLSVVRAVEAVGVQAVLTSDIKTIEKADRLILPGVGAFGHCVDEIKSRNLVEPIKIFCDSGKPLLGICVGMQLLHTLSMEFGEHNGLDIINGSVEKIPNINHHGVSNKVPYVGWAKLHVNKSCQDYRLKQIVDGKWFYHLHSYAAKTENEINTVAYYEYNDIKVTACVSKDNVIGVQFHPEKSSETGLEFLKYFFSL